MKTLVAALCLLLSTVSANAGQVATVSNGQAGNTLAVIGNTSVPQRLLDPGQQTPVGPGRASNFIESMGVNIHENLHVGSCGNSYRSEVISDLNYLGIHRARTFIANASTAAGTASDFNAMATGVPGLKLDLVYGFSGDSPNSCPPISAVQGIIDNTTPGVIDIIEGPSNVDGSSWSCDGATGNTAGNDAQRDLWNFIKGGTDANTKNINVVMRGLTGPSTISSENGFSQFAQWQTVHDYLYCCFNPGTASGAPSQFVDALSQYWWASAAPMPGSLIISTETGYHTANGSVLNPTDDATRAILIPQIFADHWLYNSSFNTYPQHNPGFTQGPTLTYVYEMRSEATTGANAGWGLFNSDTTPLPPAVAIHNMTTVLNDTGANAGTFTTTALSYSISGLPSSSHSILLQKTNGCYEMLVWQEPQVYNATGNNNTGSEVNVSAAPITVAFGKTFTTLRYYDINSSTSPPPAQGTINNAQAISMLLGKDTLIVEACP